MLGEGSVMQLLGAMAILLHLVASGQNAGEGIPMLVSGGQFRASMGICSNYAASNKYNARMVMLVEKVLPQWP